MRRTKLGFKLIGQHDLLNMADCIRMGEEGEKIDSFWQIIS